MKVIEILNLEDKNLNHFFNLPLEIYKNDPIWFRENLEEIKKQLNFSTDKNEIRTWPLIVMDEKDEPLARALAILHPKAIDKNNKKIGWISFIEVKEGEYSSLKLILDYCVDVFRNENVNEIVLPKLDNQYFGLLVKGFDKPQTLLTSHNPDYYFKYLKKYGFKVSLNITSVIYTRDTYIEKKFEVEGVKIRTFDRANLEKEIAIYHSLTNKIFGNSYDYIPRTLEENTAYVKSFLPLLDDELVIIAELDSGEPIGFLICAPDYYQQMKEGKIDRARIISIGILPKKHKRNIASAMSSVLMKNLLKKNYQYVEGSIIMKTNLPPQLLAKRFGGKPGREFVLLRKKI
ncbi:MAG: hypothetical protein ACTSPM_13910 [Candidatus Heimdallarchaeota archaeon]